MKKIYFILLVLLTLNIMAQAPGLISYQAIVRDASNNLIQQQSVGMQISILQATVTGTAVYVETQTPQTNHNGLLSIQIGNGTVITGDFSSIDWSAGPYFIKTEIDPAGGNNYTLTGTSQILSVPYALYAQKAGNAYWNQSNDNLYYENGNIAVKAQPTDINLQVGEIYNNFFTHSFQDIDTSLDRTVFISGLHSNFNPSKGVLYLGGNYVDPNEVEGSLTFVSGAYENAAIQGREANNTDWSGELVFLTRQDAGPLQERMRISQNGQIGIGTDNPGANLHIKDQTGNPLLKLESNDNIYTVWTSNRVGADDYLIGIDGGNNRFIIANTTNATYPLVISGNNMGIHTLTPKAPLHINDFMKLEPRNTPPSNPEEGMIYYDSTDKKLKVYSGTTWENLN